MVPSPQCSPAEPAGPNSHQQLFRDAVEAEPIAVRNLGMVSYVLSDDEWQRRLALEACYQLCCCCESFSDPRKIFATTAFSDLPGSRLLKGDTMRVMLEYKLQRDIDGGHACDVTDIPSLLDQGKSTANTV